MSQSLSVSVKRIRLLSMDDGDFYFFWLDIFLVVSFLLPAFLEGELLLGAVLVASGFRFLWLSGRCRGTTATRSIRAASASVESLPVAFRGTDLYFVS